MQTGLFIILAAGLCAIISGLFGMAVAGRPARHSPNALGRLHAQ